MSATYHIDFHIPVREIENTKAYALEASHELTVGQMLQILAERFATVRLLMSYGVGGRPPVAVLVDGRTMDLDDTVPSGATVKIIGAVAGG